MNYRYTLQTSPPVRLHFRSLLDIAMAKGDPGWPSTSSHLPICTVVFGRSAYVGCSLVEALVKSGRWTVRVADSLPPGDPRPIRPCPYAYFHVDVADRSSFRPAVDGAVAVFLVDPLPSPPFPTPIEEYPRLHSLAVVGAKNLIATCRNSGVRRLVYSGSADVVFDGKNEVRRATERQPYPEKYEDAINELRMQVEVLVLSANGKGSLLTCALRPSTVFGPGEPNLVNFIAREARSGRTKFVIGSGTNVCDLTYVENVVHANISAELNLRSASSSIAGKSFFITDDKRVMLWDFISKVLENFGYKRPALYIPVKLAMVVALLFKRVSRKPKFSNLPNSIFCPATINFLSCTRTFECSRAKTLLGYSPIVPYQDGVELTVKCLPKLDDDLGHLQDRDPFITSKAEIILGSGVVADILLWRDERKTFAFVLTLFVLFYWLFLSGRTFITSSAKVLMVVFLSLFIQGSLPSKMLGSNIEKIPSSCFEVSESTVRNIFFALASIWNRCVSTMKAIVHGGDWSTFFKTTVYLYLIKLVLCIPTSVLVGIGLTSLFSVFIVYEQCEMEIDLLQEAAVIGFEILTEPLIARLATARPIIARLAKSLRENA